MTDMLLRKDVEAAARLVMAGVCAPMPAGVPVSIEESSPWEGLIRVRPRGTAVAYRTNYEAVAFR